MPAAIDSGPRYGGAEEVREVRLRISARHKPLLATTVVCLLLYGTGAVLFPGFSSPQVFANFFADNAFLGIIAVGLTLVIISGGIDLSVGSVMSLCTIMMAVLMQRSGVTPLPAITIALAAGTALGFGMGCIIHFFKLAPFIVTLAGMFFARGLAMMIEMESMPISNDFYTWITDLSVGLGPANISITALIFLGVVAIGIYITGCTPFGRNLYALGGNENAAVLMGLPIGRTKVLVYTFSGFCSALAGVVFTFYQSSGSATAGMGLELDAIAVVVIGGTLLTGGAGYVIGTLLGTLIFGIIQTGIMFQGGLNSWWTKVAVGSLLLIFIVLQRLLSRPISSSRKGGKEVRSQ